MKRGSNECQIEELLFGGIITAPQYGLGIKNDMPNGHTRTSSHESLRNADSSQSSNTGSGHQQHKHRHHYQDGNVKLK